MKTVASFLKGLLWDGPKDFLTGLYEQTPLPEIREDLMHPGARQELQRTVEGRRHLLHNDLRLAPGLKPLEGLVQTALHPKDSVKAVIHRYTGLWKTPEGKGQTAFDAALLLLPFAEEDNLFKLATQGTLERLPLGISDIMAYKDFGTELMAPIREMGFSDAELHIRGSAVKGFSETKGPFDAGRVSDWDVSIASRTYLEELKERGVGIRGGGSRTEPMSFKNAIQRRALRKAGLQDVGDALSRTLKRPVTFMVYESEDAIAARGEPYLKIPTRNNK